MRKALAALVSLAALVGCSADQPAPERVPTSSPTSSRAVDPNFDAGQTVTITSDGPIPKILVASVNVPILITNGGDRPVRVVAVGDVFDTGELAPGETFRFLSNATVAIAYRAGRFRGTIQVEPTLSDDEIPGATNV